VASVTLFVQVGTSCTSTVSRGTDYTFTCSQRAEYLATGIFPFARWIHVHRQPNNLLKTIKLEMFSFANQLTDSLEPLKIGLLVRHQRIRSKMRQHFSYQIFDAPHFELESLVRSIRSDGSTVPAFLKHVEQLGSIGVLADRETRSNLPPEAVSLTGLERNAETTFTIYETRNIGIQIHNKDQGRRVMAFRPSEGSQPSTYLLQTSCGLHRFEPVVGIVSPLPRAMSLTRQGISLP
jgi:hypothetical protein